MLRGWLAFPQRAGEVTKRRFGTIGLGYAADRKQASQQDRDERQTEFTGHEFVGEQFPPIVAAKRRLSDAGIQLITRRNPVLRNCTQEASQEGQGRDERW